MRPAVVRGNHPQEGNGPGLRAQHCSSSRCLCSLIAKVDEHNDLSVSLQPRVYSRGRVIYEQGEPSTRVYWLCKGEVELLGYSPSGRARILRFLRPGELFGFEALLGKGVYRQNAYAREESLLITMRPQEVRVFFNNPQVSQTLVQAMAQALVAAEERLDALLASEMLKRVAQTLWHWVQPFVDTNGWAKEKQAGTKAGGVTGAPLPSR